ncbi:hexose transporter hxt1 [Metarhizium rileyi]|uniref:Hexose transporter hxt1 n=1 Tax=Metarhizium rileyi (strain RCEF 4871) TaxID=1649241 RepID=A0A5C6G0B3_METRR|nr:hexose transporter hxt1 [Metarhizium rileyi]
MTGFMTVRFDHVNPASGKSNKDDVRTSLAGLDYSPLPRLTLRSLAMGCLVSMGGLIFGYDTGQISGFLEMPDFLQRFGMTNPDNGDKYFSAVRSGLIVSLLSIGTLIGALVAAPVADRIGRKPSVSIWCLVTSVGFVVQIAAVTAWYQVMVGRFIAGLGVGALSLLVPMYQAETAPPWIRGAMVCAYQLFITMGIFLAATFNYGTYTHQRNSSASWRIVIGLGWIWTVILGVGILAFPETPRYDFRSGNGERAKETLCKVYGATPNHWAVYTQVEEIEAKLRAEDKVKKGPVSEFVTMFRAPKMAHRIALGVALQMFQQLTGANYFFYYGTTIFKSVQISSFITQIILNTINFLVTFIGLYIVEHYGRRKSLMTGSAWMFTCFIIFATVGHFRFDQRHPENTPTEGIVLIVFACLFILGFATTWGPMIWTIQAELFPSRYRAKGMALGTASNWIWNFCIGFFSTFIFNAIDFQYGYVFAACNVVGGLIVFFFVVEGQGRTLEEIDTMYLEGVTPWKSSQWVPPPAEHMARIRRQAGVDLETAAEASEEGLSGETHAERKKEAADESPLHRETV